MSLSLSSKGDWRHPSRHCRSDLTQKNILLAKKKEKPLLSPPSNHIEQLKPKDSRYLGIQVSFFLYRWWRSAPIINWSWEKTLSFPLLSTLPSPTYPLSTQSIHFFSSKWTLAYADRVATTIPLAQRQLCGLHRFFSPAFTPRSPGERRCNEMGSLAGPFSEEKRGGGRKVLFIFTGDSSTAHKRCQTLNLMVFQAAAALCAARLGSIPFTALACVLMWSMVQPKPW